MSLFVSKKDIDFFNHINRELIGEIIETPVNIYKVSPHNTYSNIYGESSEKVYYPPVVVNCLITSTDEIRDTNEFGPDTIQTLTVAFNREMIRLQNNYYPEVGDVIEWNYGYYEVSNVNENQFPGGKVYYNYSIICNAHLTRRAKLTIDSIRSI